MGKHDQIKEGSVTKPVIKSKNHVGLHRAKAKKQSHKAK